MKCDVCDQEFDTEAQLDQHMAEMHAAEPMKESGAEPGAETGTDKDLEEPDFKQASGE